MAELLRNSLAEFVEERAVSGIRPTVVSPRRSQQPDAVFLVCYHHRLSPRARRHERGLPFAPIRRSEDLFEDKHLLATGGLADAILPDGETAGQTVKAALLPITMAGDRLGVRLHPPRAREHTATWARS